LKRKKPIRHLHERGCEFVREGSAHSIYRNPQTGKAATVPRHVEVDDLLAKAICKQLEIDPLG
jgi:predicted RNA binding protein YcfA (HicA-like mRNA interferase family)